MFIKVKIYFSDFSLPWNFTTELSAVAITSMYLGLVLSMSGNIISGSDKVPGRRDKYVTNRNARYAFLEYTKTVDSVFCALWLATQSVNILHYSPPPSERATPNSRKLRAKCLPCCCRNKQRNFTTNQASCSRSIRRSWRSSVWKF